MIINVHPNIRAARGRLLGLLGAALFVSSTGCSGGGGGGGGTPPTTNPTIGPTVAPTSTAAPSPTPVSTLTNEQATSADAFVDSIGINTHLEEAGTPYQDAALPQISTLLQTLGVRHLRDSTYPARSPATFCAADAKIAAIGVDFEFITAVGLTDTDLATWSACTASFFESYEGPNEYDIQHPQSDTNWPATIQSFTKYLWAFAQSQPHPLTVVGPTFTTQAAWQMVGDLSGYMTYGNQHDGFAGFSPGTTGYGPGGYGSIAYNIALSKITSGNDPIRASEVPYATDGRVNSVSLPIQAKYLPRLYFDLYDAGVPRSFYYELVDEPNTADEGLVDATYAPKPAYTALQQLIGLLSDRGGSFAPPTLQYALSGNTQHVDHLLLAKRDGSFYLAFWIEQPSWDPNALKPIAVAAQPISLSFAQTPASITQYSYDAATNATLTPTTIVPQLYDTVYATDDVSILHIVPGASANAVRRRSR